MKKLKKLTINTNKIISKKELTILKGGDDGDCHCMCYSSNGLPMGLMVATNQTECYDNCHAANQTWTGTWNCMY